MHARIIRPVPLATRSSQANARRGVQPSSDKPSNDKPSSDKPSNDKPSNDKPSNDKPSNDKPSNNKPSNDKPSNDKPSNGKPTEAKPSNDKPPNDKPPNDKPAEAKPVNVRPTGVRPTGVRPIGAKQSSDKPAEAKPSSDKPSNTSAVSDTLDEVTSSAAAARPAAARPTAARTVVARPSVAGRVTATAAMTKSAPITSADSEELPLPIARSAPIVKSTKVTKSTAAVDQSADSMADQIIAECFGDAADVDTAASYVDVPPKGRATKAKTRATAPKSATAKKSTRGPGRPRKEDISSTAEIRGILTAPLDPVNILELQHHTPSIFKKLVMSLHQYDITEVNMLFDKNGMKIRTTCPQGKNNIYFDIDGRCMSQYYCEKPISVCVSLQVLLTIMKPIDRHFDEIGFMIKRNDHPMRLWCLTHESQMGGTTCHEIDMTFLNHKDDLQAYTDNESDYPIKFQYLSTRLKGLVANVVKVSDKMKIEKAGDADLQITVNCDDNPSRSSYPGNKINLESTVGEDDIVSASVYTSYVKWFTDTIIGDNVTISVDRARRMCFASSTGKRGDLYAFTAKVFIQLAP